MHWRRNRPHRSRAGSFPASKLGLDAPLATTSSLRQAASFSLRRKGNRLPDGPESFDAPEPPNRSKLQDRAIDHPNRLTISANLSPSSKVWLKFFCVPHSNE